MPLNVPNLDDRTYEDLVAEALAMLPRYAPSWTNHNPSDPGITIIELLAYFVDHFIYRLNRVSRETRIRFLQLLAGVERYDDASQWAALAAEEIDQGLRQAVRDVRRAQRAVTAEDYEHLAREATADRARAFVRRNLELTGDGGRDEDAPGHVSIVVLPAGGAPREAGVALVSQVRDYLEPKRLLATRLHVVEPFFLWIRVSATIHMRVDAREKLGVTAPEDALKTLQERGSPFVGGGPQGEGWPFGRALYLSEVYAWLEQMDGVDYVEDVDVIGLSIQDERIDERARVGLKVGRSTVGVDSWLGTRSEQGADRILVDAAGRMTGIALKPYEMIRIASRAEDFSIGEGSLARGSGLGHARRGAGGASVTPSEPPNASARSEPVVGGSDRPPGPAARRSTARDGRRGTVNAPGRLLAELPGVYHASSDLRELLSVFETILCEPQERAVAAQVPPVATLEAEIAQIATLFDVVRAPQELPAWLSERRDAFLPWLAQWVALSGPAADSLERQRQLIGRIVPLYACRGTRRYVTRLLEFYLPENTEIEVEDQEFIGLVLDKSKIGLDTWLEHDRPFWFKVTIRLPEGEAHARGRIDWPARIRQVVDLAKPAHTTYDLEMAP